MRAIILASPGELQSLALPDPREPGPDEVLIRIKQIGVCGTDYHAFRGNQPFFQFPRILGHELGVEIVALGSAVKHLAVGDKCAMRPYLNCGHCSACLRGKSNCCPNIQVFGVHIDGGMCEYAIVPASHLHASSVLTFEQLALVEPLAIGAHAVARASLTPGEQVLVIGIGPIGMAVTQFALLAGAQVTVIEISSQRLAFCQQLWPMVTCINGQSLTTEAMARRIGEELPTAVFEATGNAQSMQSAFAYVGYGGRMIFVGLFSGDVTFHDPLFHSREMALLASRNALPDDFTAIIAALEAEQFDPTPWITHRTPFSQAAEVFPQWLTTQNEVVKGMIAME